VVSGCYWWKRFWGSGTESGGFGKGADDRSVLTEGELFGFMLQWLPEKDAAQYPVNRGIVAVSQRYPSTSCNSGPMEWHKKVRFWIPSRKADLQVQGLWDDRIGGSINELKFDRRNAICRKVLSLNEYRVNDGVRRSGIHKGLQDCIRKGVGCQRECEWVRVWKSRCVKSDGFAWGSLTQSSGQCRVSGTAQSFFESELVDADFSWSVFDALALEEAEVDFGNPWRCVQRCHKRGKACCQTALSLLGS